MSDARKKAEEALAKWDRMFHSTTLYSRGAWDCAQGKCVSALRLLLAEEPEAAVLPLEAPECNDGDDCCRYCGRGLQPCGACKPAPPPADAAKAAPLDHVAILTGLPVVLNGVLPEGSIFMHPRTFHGLPAEHPSWLDRMQSQPVTPPPADAATEAVFTLRALLEEEENCGCGPLYCEHVVSVVVAARALVSAIAARRGA